MNFSYKEIDIEGEETLERIGGAQQFNFWMYSVIKPYCSGKVLELGSGIGNVSTYFVNDVYSITLSDIRPNYCKKLEHRFKESSAVEEIRLLDLVHPDFNTEYNDLLGTFDTVFALNLIEHIENDLQAIRNCNSLLKPGGKLIILVPAYQRLYNSFDKSLLHYRRYSRKSLKQLINSSDQKLMKLFSFNFIGIFGWFWSGSVLKEKIIPDGQMRMFNRMVPIIRLFDWMVFRRLGLSLISISICRDKPEN
ncbi:MAG: class I SAM-dependent methyltransferase [Marinilabiliales bacterium]|nr:MAG: class I SAM-dependent methyltransferase [Marinilabiliales bacterium]